MTVWKKGLRCVKGTLFYLVFDSNSPFMCMHLRSSSTSASNQEVKRKIVQEIKDTPGIEYTQEIKRYIYICM